LHVYIAYTCIYREKFEPEIPIFQIPKYCARFLTTKPTRCINFLKFIFEMKLYMFRTVPLSIIRSYSLYARQWYVSYRFVDSFRAGSGRFHPDPARTVRNTQSFISKIKFEKTSASIWFCCKEICHDARSHERKIVIALVWRLRTDCRLFPFKGFRKRASRSPAKIAVHYSLTH
jgi:hypothetical protein